MFSFLFLPSFFCAPVPRSSFFLAWRLRRWSCAPPGDGAPPGRICRDSSPESCATNAAALLLATPSPGPSCWEPEASCEESCWTRTLPRAGKPVSRRRSVSARMKSARRGKTSPFRRQSFFSNFSVELLLSSERRLLLAVLLEVPLRWFLSWKTILMGILELGEYTRTSMGSTELTFVDNESCSIPSGWIFRVRKGWM